MRAMLAFLSRCIVGGISCVWSAASWALPASPLPDPLEEAAPGDGGDL